MNCLPVGVYRDRSIGDCTNHGVTSRHDRMYLFSFCSREEAIVYCEEHGFDPDECLMLVKRELWNEDHSYAEPLVKGKGCQSFGGHFIYTSDSRLYKTAGLRTALPIPVHDRYELHLEMT